MKKIGGILATFLLCQLLGIEIVVNSSCLSTLGSDNGCGGEHLLGEDEGRRNSWGWGHRSKRSRKSSRVNISYNCTCGMRPQEQIKIVGGQLARDNAWPWVVPLIYTGDSEPWQFCGASIINSQYLLTAAHCAVEMKKKIHSYQAYLGTNSISGRNHVRAHISRIKTHPKFNSKTLENDIALIKLSRPITFSEKVQPICLSQDANPYVCCSGVVTGWGSVRQGGKGVDRMREVKVKVLNNYDCARNYSAAKVKIAGGMMCAATPPKDSCQGDSGGPLFAWHSNSKAYSQIGIVSFGLSCGSQTYPGVYTRVSTYINWIKEKTKDAYFCNKSF